MYTEVVKKYNLPVAPTFNYLILLMQRQQKFNFLLIISYKLPLELRVSRRSEKNRFIITGEVFPFLIAQLYKTCELWVKDTNPLNIYLHNNHKGLISPMSIVNKDESEYRSF